MLIVMLSTPDVESRPLYPVIQAIRDVVASHGPIEGTRIMFQPSEGGSHFVVDARVPKECVRPSRVITAVCLYDESHPIFSSDPEAEKVAQRMVAEQVVGRFENNEVAVCFVQTKYLVTAPPRWAQA